MIEGCKHGPWRNEGCPDCAAECAQADLLKAERMGQLQKLEQELKAMTKPRTMLEAVRERARLAEQRAKELSSSLMQDEADRAYLLLLVDAYARTRSAEFHCDQDAYEGAQADLTALLERTEC